MEALPDKIVADEVVNYVHTPPPHHTHLFSNIYKGRTTLNPAAEYKWHMFLDKITLYDGGWGQGNYIEVSYSTKENMYIYASGNGDSYTCNNTLFKSGNWVEFHEYVRKDLHEMFVHFNTPSSV